MCMCLPSRMDAQHGDFKHVLGNDMTTEAMKCHFLHVPAKQDGCLEWGFQHAQAGWRYCPAWGFQHVQL